MRLFKDNPTTRFLGKHEQLWVFCFYVLFFCLLFIPIVKGVGQYWDWSFPLFSDQIQNLFNRVSTSWTPQKMGSPLGYTSDIYVSFIISLFSFINPEILRYIIFALLFTLISFGGYKISRHYKIHPAIAFIIGLVCALNPAIFYKFTAGHFNYFVSYAVFIFFVYYLFAKFKGNIKSYIIAGTFLAFIGAQIQFFLIGFLLFFLFIITRGVKKQLKYIPLVILIPVGVNFLWLSNFLFGGSDLNAIGAGASQQSFRASSSTTFINIFTFVFSKATLLSKYFTSLELIACSSLLMVTVYALIRSKNNKYSIMVFVYLLVMIFLSTGLFQVFDVKPFNALYPMFREVGHFAPIVIFTSILLIILNYKILPRIVKIIFTTICLLIIIFNALKFIQYPQAIDFNNVRSQFSEFKQNDDKNKDNVRDYRILAYPFFGKYSFNNFDKASEDGLPIKNVGNDSYSTFSNQDFIHAAVAPNQFDSSIQYQLLKTRNVDVLKPYGVRYIYDFSKVYESNFSTYVTPSVYHSDKELIENNSELFNDLLSKNEGKLKRISPNIYEIKDYSKKVEASNTLYSVDSSKTGTDALSFVKSTLKPEQYYFTTDNVHTTQRINGLFNNTNDPGFINTNSKSLSQAIEPDKSNGHQLYSNTNPTNIQYSIDGNIATIYGYRDIDITTPSETVAKSSTQMKIGDVQLKNNEKYFIQINDSVHEITQDSSDKNLGVLSPNATVKTFSANTENLVLNPSFESGAWKPKVSDCNNSDNSPHIGMRLDKSLGSDGSNSINLNATNHTACTYTNFSAKNNTYYYLSYDFQTQNQTPASHFISFSFSTKNSVKGQYYSDSTSWQNTKQLFISPNDTKFGSLLLHADPVSTDTGSADINYDNVQLYELNLLKTYNPSVIYDASKSFTSTEIKDTIDTTTTFKYNDKNYTYKNLIKNSSFDKELWQKEVYDCSKYDFNPRINMSRVLVNKSNYALQLESTKHNACTNTAVDVKGGSKYQFSFKYNSLPNTQYGYMIKFNDKNDTQYSSQSKSKTSGWNKAAYSVDAPSDATKAKIYLYAYETNGLTNNIVRYDDISFTEIPESQNQYYLLSKENTKLDKPKDVSYIKNSNTSYTINVKGASTPFYLNLSESYHPAWKLESIINNRSFDVQGIEHYKQNNYANGWYIDPVSFCNASNSCQKNNDGSYNFALTTKFSPQNAFVISTIASITSLVTLCCYALITVLLNRKKKQ